jgi:hypothetical protein
VPIFVDLAFLCCLRVIAAMISLNPVAFLHPARSARDRSPLVDEPPVLLDG